MSSWVFQLQCLKCIWYNPCLGMVPVLSCWGWMPTVNKIAFRFHNLGTRGFINHTVQDMSGSLVSSVGRALVSTAESWVWFSLLACGIDMLHSWTRWLSSVSDAYPDFFEQNRPHISKEYGAHRQYNSASLVFYVGSLSLYSIYAST